MNHRAWLGHQSFSWMGWRSHCTFQHPPSWQDLCRVSTFSGTLSSSLWATDSGYWVEIPMSAERQVRTTGLCTVTVVSVTRMKDFITGSAKQKRKEQNDHSPFSYFYQLLCSQQTYWLHNNHSGWRHWGYNNKEVTCGLDLTHVACVTQIQPLFPGTLFPLSCKQCIFIIVSLS